MAEGVLMARLSQSVITMASWGKDALLPRTVVAAAGEPPAPREADVEHAIPTGEPTARGDRSRICTGATASQIHPGRDRALPFPTAPQTHVRVTSAATESGLGADLRVCHLCRAVADGPLHRRHRSAKC